MSALRNLVDKLKPTFTKGGKLGFLESTFDAFETFLFVPDTTTSKGAHIRDCNDMKRTMIMVVVALMPALLFGFYNTGYMHFLSQGVQPEFWASLWFGFLKVLPLIVVVRRRCRASSSHSPSSAATRSTRASWCRVC